MRRIDSIVEDVADIYHTSGRDAEEYLYKARKLKEEYGPGLAVVYCWFYSVPQKWSQVEPKVFDLMKKANSFDLDEMLAMPVESLASKLKPIIFYNKIALQLKRFCETIRAKYGSWGLFCDILCEENIFSIFKALRRFEDIRLTFKNLAAMKIFVGLEDNLLILDTHVAKVLGINNKEASKYRVRELLFRSLLTRHDEITERLRLRGIDTCMAKWSLAIWFNGAKIKANSLLLSHQPR